jgi:hypothetical protein
MLTEEHYTALWRNPAPHGFGQSHAMPSYHEYCIRENQIQDYLDIFRGRNTRADREFNDGEHPYQEYLNPENPPCIKYIMIGEAAPPLNPIIAPLRDWQNTFFYNPNHLGPTQYFSAPCNAFGINPRLSKLEKLLALAQKGVLLLDLFPFAVSYSTEFREHLRYFLVVEFFWDSAANPYSVVNRIEEIRSLLCKEVQLAFVAPPLISHYLAEGINLPGWPTFGLLPRLGINTLTPPIVPAILPYPPFIRPIPAGAILNGVHPITYFLPLGGAGGCIQVPTYACCCYSGSNLVPHELFIRNAFGL